ncbi:general transcription factor 3C polypeptide 6 [Perognathus longimembris pacificus]|uniref:general transcription factor 3C polypeptide 6 n=1 Tax=Perognathus longimembris pacificus TaxID=214514 RepID=UPI002019C447|nr:general transcription factor 3C polypeptide 6 [Perognathus longimembris pacificus]
MNVRLEEASQDKLLGAREVMGEKKRMNLNGTNNQPNSVLKLQCNSELPGKLLYSLLPAGTGAPRSQGFRVLCSCFHNQLIKGQWPFPRGRERPGPQQVASAGGRHLGFWRDAADLIADGVFVWAWTVTAAWSTRRAMAAAESESGLCWEIGEEEAEEEEEEEEEEDDDDVEEEEQFVLVELTGIIDSDFLSKCEKKCKILGIDTERPILQVDSYVFAGEYEDTLGTCVIFEENVEHVDAEGNDKTLLKYKCHTMKKLSMTRTLLTEKKEGEENIGGVEWLQMKENDFSYRPNMICSFVHENEDEVIVPAPEKPLDLEEQEIQMKDSSNLIYEQEKPMHLGLQDLGPLAGTPSEVEGSIFMETQDDALEISP